MSGLSTYTKRNWLADSTATLQALDQTQTASAPPVAFVVRNIENGYVVVHKGAEYFCDDFVKVAARVVAILAADAMDQANRPEHDEVADTLRYMMAAFPRTSMPGGI